MSVAIPAELARQIQATLAVTNNFAFDLLRGQLRGKPRPAIARPRYTSRVREGFSRAYNLAVASNHPILDVDHVIIGFLLTPDCEEYFRAVGLDKQTTHQRCQAELSRSLVVGRLLTGALLPMTTEVGAWHDLALKLTTRRQPENDAIDVDDLFDAFLNAAATDQHIGVDETDVLKTVRGRLARVEDSKRLKPLRQLLIDDLQRIDKRIDETLKGIGIGAEQWKVGDSLIKQLLGLHEKLKVSADEKTTIGAKTVEIHSTAERIHKLVKPVSGSLAWSVISVALVTGLSGGWLARLGWLF